MNKELELLKKFEGNIFKESQSQAGIWLQYTLQKVESGEVHFTLPVRDVFTNPIGGLHGGIFALIMDEAIGLSFYTVCNGEYYTTVNLNVEHLYSAREGELLTAWGKVIRHGKKIAYVEGWIENAEKKLICKATSNLINTGKRIFDVYAK